METMTTTNEIGNNEAVVVKVGKNNNHGSHKFPIDSLPYIDPVHDDYEQYALALIEDEMKSNQQYTSDFVQRIGKMNFRTNMMRKEYESLSSTKREGKETLLQESLNDTSTLNVLDDSVEEWQKAVQHARVAYEVERIRSMQLEIEKDGPGCAVDSWKLYIETILNPTRQLLEEDLKKQKNAVELTNYNRQKEQTEYGRQLNVLKNQYNDLVGQHFQLKVATTMLEREIQHMETHQ